MSEQRHGAVIDLKALHSAKFSRKENEIYNAVNLFSVAIKSQGQRHAYQRGKLFIYSFRSGVEINAIFFKLRHSFNNDL